MFTEVAVRGRSDRKEIFWINKSVTNEGIAVILKSSKMSDFFDLKV